MNRLADIFLSRVRAELFRRLFGVNRKPVYLTQLKNETGFASRSIEQQLAKLKALDLIIATPDGGRVNYTANANHPIYSELCGIVLKTAGLHDILQQALTSPKIEHAFVFGSLAQLSERAESDVDLMVIGSLGRRDLTSLLHGVADQLGREINSHIYSRDELARRLAMRDHFLKDVLSKPKLFIWGNEHELNALVENQLASSAPSQP
jgi:predicted nucleotidyltransferase